MIENRQIMAKNILKYMEQENLKATDICKALGFKQNTFSDWVNAKTYPRIDAIEKLANYFNISKADLVEDTTTEYYQDKATAVMAEKLFESKEMRLLFDAAKDSKPEDLKMAANLLLRLKGTNPDG